MTYREAKHLAQEQLLAAGIEEAAYDSFALLSDVCELDRTRYLLEMDQPVPAGQLDIYFKAVAERAGHVPLQHILGKAYFCGHAFRVTSDTLIPRPETELLVQEAIRIIRGKYRETDAVQGSSRGKDCHRSPLSVLDMCTGSGCIAISIALECPQVCITACDLSEDALAVAEENASSLQAGVLFIRGDLFGAVEDTFDVIVSNPPYIPTEVIGTLSEEVRLFDPRMALDGGEDGLRFYRRIAAEAKEHLAAGGVLLMEIGADQAATVSEILISAGYGPVSVRKDLAGLDRVILAGR